MERIDLEIIREFIQRINKGPLKCPPDFEGDDVCVKIGYEVDERSLTTFTTAPFIRRGSI